MLLTVEVEGRGDRRRDILVAVLDRYAEGGGGPLRAVMRKEADQADRRAGVPVNVVAAMPLTSTVPFTWFDDREG